MSEPKGDDRNSGALRCYAAGLCAGVFLTYCGIIGVCVVFGVDVIFSVWR